MQIAGAPARLPPPPARAAAAASRARPAFTSSQPRPQQRQRAALRLVAAAGEPGAGASGRRRLILLRHADSEQATGVRDHDRPISHQGRREAASIGGRLADLGWLPDLIIASNSVRTKQTLDAMAEAQGRIGQADAHYLGRWAAPPRPRSRGAGGPPSVTRGADQGPLAAGSRVRRRARPACFLGAP